MSKTTPISLEDRRAARRASLPNALTTEQLRRRAVARMRYTIANLAEDKLDDAKQWLDDVRKNNGAKEALELYLKLLEYAVPKLSRTEVASDERGEGEKVDLTIDELQEIIREGRTYNGECEYVEPVPE